MNEVVLREHQKPMTIEEQVENLKSLGLIVSDEEYAKRVLKDISYFRLIKAYSLGLKPKNGQYCEGVTFENIVDLYMFNMEFRRLLFPIIEIVEVTLRCRVANYFCCKYGVLGYKESDNFAVEEYHSSLLHSIEEELKRNSSAPFVTNFMNNYQGGELPLYALTELFSFGTLSKFYKNMKNSDKKSVAAVYGVGYTYLESWIEHLSFVRNICAHYGRLYNAKMPKTPILYKEYSEKGVGNNRVFATLVCLKCLSENKKEWNSFVKSLNELVNKYDNVKISSMGFPENWIDVLSN